MFDAGATRFLGLATSIILTKLDFLCSS